MTLHRYLVGHFIWPQSHHFLPTFLFVVSWGPCALIHCLFHVRFLPATFKEGARNGFFKLAVVHIFQTRCSLNVEVFWCKQLNASPTPNNCQYMLSAKMPHSKNGQTQIWKGRSPHSSNKSVLIYTLRQLKIESNNPSCTHSTPCMNCDIM